MNTPTPKSTKSRRPRAENFHEALAPALPLAPATTGLNRSHLRLLGIAAWAALTVALGVAIGLLLIRQRAAQTPAAAELPLPVATTTLTVTATPATPAIHSAAATAGSVGVVQPAGSIQQAQSGSPLAVAGTVYYQPSVDSVQPGYTSFTGVQGTQGTAPVRTSSN